ncbi:FAD:protein FMN transferase [Aquimarina agarivorans]|uniref:FAD:protein FMN transferase n=1 Tax=Aquimarina agarivorans TaxID=980584 RepID=UPI000248F295|nr:FAD:protein FMN transferase [Aquimarina agarivorans]
MYKIHLLLFIVSLLISCSSKKNEPKVYNQTGRALGTTFTILYVAPKQVGTMETSLDSIFQVINKSMSTYISTSDISKINSGDTSVKVDAMFAEVFTLSKKIHQVSKGYFDPTVGELVNAWGFGPKMGVKQMQPQVVDSLMQFVGFDKVKLKSDYTIQKSHPNIYLDFNAIAKGYCLDRIAAYLDSEYIGNYLIELGGELVAKGTKIIAAQEQVSWTVGIDDPNQTTERTLITTLKLKDKAMATSGNYRKFRVDTLTGKKYVHTIDPFTGYTKPSAILSASVIASNCALADGYATAFMAMPLKETKAVLKTQPLDAYIIYSDASGSLKTYITNGFQSLLNE